MMKISCSHFFKQIAAFSAVLSMLLLVGCGGNATDQKPVAEVKGVVSYEGKPLERGQIIFFPEFGAKIGQGQIQPDGSYELTTYESGDGALLGKHQVAIISERDMEGVLPEDAEADQEPSLIPTKYNLQKTSGLTAEVKEGGNEINFDLE